MGDVRKPAFLGASPPEGPEPEGPPEKLRRRYSIDDPGVQAAIKAAEEREKARWNNVEAPKAYVVKFMCKPSEFASILDILRSRMIWNKRYRELPANKIRQDSQLPGMEENGWVKE